MPRRAFAGLASLFGGQLLLARVAGGEDAFSDCEDKVVAALLPTPDIDHPFETHAYTSRGLAEFESALVPPWLSLDALLDGAQSALEIGAGNGRLLLEATHRWPSVHFVGTNLAGFPLPQLDARLESLVAASEHFGVPIACRGGLDPVLPSVVLTGDIGSPEPSFRDAAALPAGAFDSIVSQHALNSGGVQPDAMAVVVRALADLLAPGGTAVVHLSSLPPALAPAEARGRAAAVLARRAWAFRGGRAALALVSLGGASPSSSSSSSATGRPGGGEEGGSSPSSSRLVLLLRRCPADGSATTAAPSAAAGSAARGGCDALLSSAAAASLSPPLWPALVRTLQEFTPGSQSFDEAWVQRALLSLDEALQRWDAAGSLDGEEGAAAGAGGGAEAAQPLLLARGDEDMDEDYRSLIFPRGGGGGAGPEAERAPAAAHASAAAAGGAGGGHPEASSASAPAGLGVAQHAPLGGGAGAALLGSARWSSGGRSHPRLVLRRNHERHAARRNVT